MTKWLSGDTETGRVMLIRKQRIQYNCPRFNEPDDHTTHVLRYQPEDMFSLRDETITGFRVWFRSVITQLNIDSFMYHRIKSWLTEIFKCVF